MGKVRTARRTFALCLCRTKREVNFARAVRCSSVPDWLPCSLFKAGSYENDRLPCLFKDTIIWNNDIQRLIGGKLLFLGLLVVGCRESAQAWCIRVIVAIQAWNLVLYEKEYVFLDHSGLCIQELWDVVYMIWKAVKKWMEAAIRIAFTLLPLLPQDGATVAYWWLEACRHCCFVRDWDSMCFWLTYMSIWQSYSSWIYVWHAF